MIRQTTSQKLDQVFTPQQIQLMKLLELSTINLEQRIKEELEENPAMEEGASADEGDLYDKDDTSDLEGGDDGDYELDEYIQDYMDDDPMSYKLKANNYSADDDTKSAPVVVHDSFFEYLEKQLGIRKFESETDEIIAHQLVGSIDEDGYLRREPIAIIDDLMFTRGIFVEVQQVEAMVEVIQQFEPAGVCARNLQECLELQLQRKLDKEEYSGVGQAVDIANGLEIVSTYFNEFTKKHFDKLRDKMELSDEDLKSAYAEIVKLNPKPASGYAEAQKQTIQYVVPDFIIQNRDGVLDLQLNNKNNPDLHLSSQYVDMWETYKGRTKNKRDKETKIFIKKKLESAKWFIDAVKQRYNTLFNTMYAIMEYQYDYFTTGDKKKLRPMVLKDIAEITGLDISTVSRVANDKFVQTEFGTSILKEFFSESLQTEEGEDVSTLQVKSTLKDIINEEDKKKPLSDDKLTKLLKEKGYKIARRTVAKYREQLNIPVARLRKEL